MVLHDKFTPSIKVDVQTRNFSLPVLKRRSISILTRDGMLP